MSARARYIVRRLVMLVASLLVASFLIFAAMYAAPGTPLAALSGGRSLTPEAQAALEARYHLNDPFLVQYWNWLKSALHGDFGVSIMFRGQDVSTAIATRLPITIELVLYASVLIVFFGIALGVIAGIRPGFLDKTVVLGATTLAAIPAFVAAIVLITVFSVQLGWFPAIGAGTGGIDRFKHLTLPAIALALSAVAVVMRVTRTAIREEAGKEHVQTAVSRGLPRSKIVRSHILRNASIPIATVTGITIASLIAISAVVETAFGLDGVGALLVRAAGSKDLAVVQAIALLLVAAFVVVNLIVDLLYAVLDPRVSVAGDES